MSTRTNKDGHYNDDEIAAYNYVSEDFEFFKKMIGYDSDKRYSENPKKDDITK